MGYLNWLREYIGTAKVPVVFTAGCVRDDRGRVLWQRRSDFDVWGLPGGSLEIEESLPECVVREVREETGLDVAVVRLVGIYSTPDFDVVYPNGDQVQQVTFSFECRVVGGELHSDGEETLDLAWYPVDQLPETFPWYTAMVNDLAQDKPEVLFAHGRSRNGSRNGGPLHRRIRKLIGKQRWVMVGASGLVQDDLGRVLLQRRSDTNTWGLPAGALELGERIDQTVINEVREETGIDVEPLRVVGVYSDKNFFWTYPNGDQVKVVSVLFACRVVGGQLQADGEESLEVQFFDVDNLPPLSERHIRRIRDALRQDQQIVY